MEILNAYVSFLKNHSLFWHIILHNDHVFLQADVPMETEEVIAGSEVVVEEEVGEEGQGRDLTHDLEMSDSDDSQVRSQPCFL